MNIPVENLGMAQVGFYFRVVYVVDQGFAGEVLVNNGLYRISDVKQYQDLTTIHTPHGPQHFPHGTIVDLRMTNTPNRDK